MATEKRLIDAHDLWSDIMMLPHNGDMISSEEVEQAIMDAPTVNAVEVVHGFWVDKHYKIACSVCENAVFIGTSDPLIHKEEKKNLKYCPNCGAKMDGDGNG